MQYYYTGTIIRIIIKIYYDSVHAHVYCYVARTQADVYSFRELSITSKSIINETPC